MTEFGNEYPSNSHKSKEEEVKAESAEPKSVEKVVSGSVIRKKPSLLKRFGNVVLPEDPKELKRYIVQDVVIPGVRDFFVDLVIQTVEKGAYGQARSKPRGSFLQRAVATPGYVSYNRYSQPATPGKRPEIATPRATGPASKPVVSFDIDEIVLSTRMDAETVVEGMQELLQKYEQVTVADLYGLIGETGPFTYEKWGWTDIRGIDIQRIAAGYLLVLPKPQSLV